MAPWLSTTADAPGAARCDLAQVVLGRQPGAGEESASRDALPSTSTTAAGTVRLAEGGDEHGLANLASPRNYSGPSQPNIPGDSSPSRPQEVRDAGGCGRSIGPVLAGVMVNRGPVRPALVLVPDVTHARCRPGIKLALLFSQASASDGGHLAVHALSSTTTSACGSGRRFADPGRPSRVGRAGALVGQSTRCAGLLADGGLLGMRGPTSPQPPTRDIEQGGGAADQASNLEPSDGV